MSNQQQTVPQPTAVLGRGVYILVNADYHADISNVALCVQTAGVLVVLPDNPTVGETSLEILSQGVPFNLSGGLNPFAGDPLPIAADATFIVSFTGDGWKIIGSTSPVPPGGEIPAVVFDPKPPGSPTTNIRSDRSANQSPITGLPVGATNLGSDTTGATTGVSGDYATVGGGNQNVASGTGATVGGGLQNKATGALSSALGGFLALALAEFALAAGGEEAVAAALGSVALGTESLASGALAAAINGGDAYGDESFAASGAQATGNASVAIGSGQVAGAGAFPFTIPAGGVLVTIAGTDATGAFQNGDTVAVLPVTPGFAPAPTGLTVASVPVFAAGDTTFNLSGPIDGVTTGGQIADTNLGVGAAAIGGSGNQASGDGSSIVGGQDNVTTVTASSARAGGKLARATRVTQDAWASGSDNATAGNIQTSQIVLAGTTPGTGVGETVELRIDPLGGNEPFQIDDNKGYTLRLSIIAQGVIGGVRARQSFEVEVTVGQDGGVVTVDAANVITQQGSAAAAGWSIAVTAGAAPARIVVTFSTGGTQAKTVVAAQTRFTEAFLPLA